MSPLDRLLAETIPIRPQPAPGTQARDHQPSHWTQAQRDAHWQALCDAVGTPGAARPAERVNARQNAA
ncbi:hypothetical protein [Streptomyces rubradiris]|uniref:Uncharacterized protein n=1 Tax=Streptomyces rubradiris TaxID=285531 RepID=A0ABQ3R3E8_STRRR|nr:hypothetical protein [Streptomyces rubradiris]GHH30050.1 hypothetical protein GCM10018792_75970 [Streptomyces rubradiris]GHI50378.1 hypothetical protein Srubr_02240 [Streptomyces rubradiris]